MAVEDFTNDAGQKMNIGLEVIKTQTRGKRQLAFGGPINAMNAFPGFNVSSLFLVKENFFVLGVINLSFFAGEQLPFVCFP